MTAKEQGLPELPQPRELIDYDDYCVEHYLASDMRAYALAALASDTGERGVGVNPEIIGNPDAAAWADCFAKAHPKSTIGWDVMVGWFANAMMAAHDHALAKPVKITPDVLAAVAGYYHDGPVRNWDVVRAIESSIAALTQPQPVAPPESGGQGEAWVPVSERMPPDDVMVLVYWTEEGEERYDFDAIEEGMWVRHSEHYDNYLTVALPEGSRGPSEQAPYTHWRVIEGPAAIAQGGGNER